MADEDWGDGPIATTTTTTYDAITPAAVAPAAELPEIKLFGRWTCDDVEVSDMSLQVSLVFFFFYNSTRNITKLYYS